MLQVWGRCLFFARAVPTWTVYSDISALWDQTRSPLVLCSFPVHSTAGTLSAPSPNTTASETAPLPSTLCCVSHSAISDSLRPHGLSMGFSIIFQRAGGLMGFLELQREARVCSRLRAEEVIKNFCLFSDLRTPNLFSFWDPYNATVSMLDIVPEAA